MRVPNRFSNMPIFAKVIHAINWFIDLVYVENGALFSRATIFIMLIVMFGIGFVVVSMTGFYFYNLLF